ncbi:hypothetical protein V2J09_001058 [Rumex salicifolius]
MFPAESLDLIKGLNYLKGQLGLAIKRAGKVVELMHILSKLRDPQSELLLFRSCMGIAKLLFGLRICQPKGMRVERGDKEHRGLWRLSTRPIRYGGLGLYSASEESQYAFIASRLQSWDLQDHVYRRRKKRLLTFWLVHLRGDRHLGQQMSLFLSVNRKHTCVNLNGVSPFTGIRYATFTVGQATLMATSGKVSKHDKACRNNGHVFILFSFDIFGFLALEAVGLLKRVQKVMHSNVMTPRSRDFVFQRIGFAIQKGLITQLVARLPAKSMCAATGKEGFVGDCLTRTREELEVEKHRERQRDVRATTRDACKREETREK